MTTTTYEKRKAKQENSLAHQWAFDSAKIGMVSEIGTEWADAHPHELDGYGWLILEVDAIANLFQQQLYGLAIAQAFHGGVLAGRQLVDYLGMEVVEDYLGMEVAHD